MTLDQIKQVAAKYKSCLNLRGYITPKRYTSDDVADYHGRYPHLLWMCQEILDGKVDGEKSHRWLGFMQGVFWDDCQYTVGQLKDHNR